MTGLFVTVDGMGGAGKTTLVEHLHRYLTDRGHPVHATTEPSHERLGEIARHQTSIYSGHTLACLVAADRYHHLTTEIRPHLDAGRIVLCDRYITSSYVLQYMDGVPLTFVEALNAEADRPDLAVVLTAEPEVAAARIAQRGAHSRFEAGITTSVREAALYREVAERLTEDGWRVAAVDTTTVSPEHLAAEIGERITAQVAVRTTGPDL
ncbi:dTMP kinase [Amycolatopsis anabasis]|uniref:dTMP kinase n=1 Tax=Amycolatopsis anabasis TaxID=1840409 RepID=UPI00131C3AEB|nr:dTMP kinase [Amycolatopsis anabasis]